MSTIIDISKEQDLPGCVEAPVFLKELLLANKELQRPVQTMLEILFELAAFISKVSNPTLRILALRLGLFPMSQDELKKALATEMERSKKLAERQG